MLTLVSYETSMCVSGWRNKKITTTLSQHRQTDNTEEKKKHSCCLHTYFFFKFYFCPKRYVSLVLICLLRNAIAAFCSSFLFMHQQIIIIYETMKLHRLFSPLLHWPLVFHFICNQISAILN